MPIGHLKAKKAPSGAYWPPEALLNCTEVMPSVDRVPAGTFVVGLVRPAVAQR